MYIHWVVKRGQGRVGCGENTRAIFDISMFNRITLNPFLYLFPRTANIMPKRNATESSTTNFQDSVIVNSSNSNLNNSRMVDPAGESKMKKQIPGEDEGECDAIGDLIGHYGKWQFVMTILLSLFQVPNTFHIVSPSFQVISSTFVCIICRMPWDGNSRLYDYMEHWFD